MKFDRNAIRTTVSSFHVSDEVTLEEIKYFCDPKNKTKLQDKAVQLIILSCRAPGPNSTTKAFGGSYTKRQLLNKAYHRYFLCADASNPPHCFALITNTMAQTHQLLNNITDESFLGVSFYLVEPNITKTKMGGYLPVLNCEDDSLLPLEHSSSRIEKATHIELPGTAETFYFILENRKIAMSRIKTPHDVSCTGLQCDRQKKKGECICIQFAPGFPLVYTFDIAFEVDPKVMHGETNHVTTFRSFRTTEIFFRNFIEYSSTTTFERERHMQQKRRRQMQLMVEFINNNGGWKIIGWCKKGEVLVDGETEKVENNDVSLNLTYVYPSNDEVFQKDEFRALQIYDDLNEIDGDRTTPPTRVTNIERNQRGGSSTTQNNNTPVRSTRSTAVTPGRTDRA